MIPAHAVHAAVSGYVVQKLLCSFFSSWRGRLPYALPRRRDNTNRAVRMIPVASRFFRRDMIAGSGMPPDLWVHPRPNFGDDQPFDLRFQSGYRACGIRGLMERCAKTTRHERLTLAVEAPPAFAGHVHQHADSLHPALLNS
jgi:hypothetical protein